MIFSAVLLGFSLLVQVVAPAGLPVTYAQLPQQPVQSGQPVYPPLTTGSSIWQWENPRPQGNDLYGVACQGSFCVATGDNGTLLRSADKGNSWKSYLLGENDISAPTFGEVVCPIAGVCYTLGNNNILTYTSSTDKWQPSPDLYKSNIGVIPVLKSIACVTISNCVAVGFYFILSGPYYEAAVFSTTNGWRTATAQSIDLAKPLNSVACLSATVCYAVGDSGTLVKINPTGRTPAILASGTTQNLESVACDGSSCYGVGEKGQAISDTANQPDSWTQQQLPVGTATLESLSCPTTNTCEVLGLSGGLGGILIRNGASLNWIGQTLPQAQTEMYKITCQDINDCLAVGAYGSMYIYNGSWTNLSYDYQRSLAGVSCFDDSTCLAVGDGGVILRTIDAGDTWSQISGAIPVSVSLYAITCPAQDTCYASGSNGLIYKITGITNLIPGVSLPLETNNGAFKGIGCRNATHCIAVGANGQVAYTNDGQSWTYNGITKPPSMVSANLNAVSCLPGGICVAVGNGGHSYYSSNNGSSWVDNSLAGKTTDLTGISCALTCRAVGATLIVYLDLNLAWQQENVPAYYLDKNAISCTSAFCVAAGLDGVVTTNYSTGWNEHPYLGTNNFAGVSCAQFYCIVVGEGGAILRSPYFVTSPTDAGIIDFGTPGKLSYALTHLAAGQYVAFEVTDNKLQIKAKPGNIGNGVGIWGGPCESGYGSRVTLDGQGQFPGLSVSGENHLKGITLINTKGPGITAKTNNNPNGGNNIVNCVSTGNTH